MATNYLYVPKNNGDIEVFDISTGPPVLSATWSSTSATNSQTVAIDGSANVFVADRTSGRISKFDPSGTELLNVLHLQNGEGPNSLVVDHNDDVWAFYANGEPTLKLSNAGLVITASETTAVGNLVGVGVSSTYDAVVAYDNATGTIYRISTISNLVVFSQDIDTLLTVPGTIATASDEITQIAACGDKVYITVSLLPGPVDPFTLVILDLDTNTITVGDGTDEVESTAVFCDGSYVYVADKASRIFKYTLTGGLVASFNIPTTVGMISGITASDTPDFLYLIDDGFFTGKQNWHYLDTNTGITTSFAEVSGSSAGRVVAGDYTGFQRLNNILPTVPGGVLPTLDIDKVCAYVREDGRVDVYGFAGASKDALSVNVRTITPPAVIIVGIIPAADGSFSGVSAIGAGTVEGFQEIDIELVNLNGTVNDTLFTFPKVKRYADQKLFEEGSLAHLEELVGRPVDILGVPRKSVTDFTTWGGYVARRLQDIYRIVSCLQNSISKFSDVEIFSIKSLTSLTYVVQGDTPTIKFTIVDNRSGRIVDITGSDIVFEVFDAAQGNILIFRKDCEIISGANGACEATLTAADTAAVGEFFGMVKVTFPGGEILSTPRFRLNVAPTA